MGPIMPVGVGLPGPVYGQTSPLDRAVKLAGTPDPGRAEALSATSLDGQTRAIMQVFSAVSQLLQSIGGGVEQDKALRLLIVLMILLALLDSSRTPEETTTKFSDGLAASARQMLFYSYSSSTAIAIQHTTTTTTVAFADSMSAWYGGSQPVSGANIDVPA